jgi:hypothetical protein
MGNQAGIHHRAGPPDESIRPIDKETLIESHRLLGVSGVTAPKRRKSLPQILVRRSKAPLRQHVRQFDLGSSRQPEADDLLNFLQDQADQIALFCVCTMP